MSKTLTVLENAAHGTPAGFTAGCRSRGGCPNHGSREELTCTRAHQAFVHYWGLRELDPTSPITRSMLREAKGRN